MNKEYTTKILNLLDNDDNEYFTPEFVLDCCLRYMGESNVRDMCNNMPELSDELNTVVDYTDMVKGDGVFYDDEYYIVVSINTASGNIESPLDKITIVNEYIGSETTIEVYVNDVGLKTPVDDTV
jgi:hypothetical protein